MCGIVAYIGDQAAAPLLLEGLKRLEYRGYDSAGLAVLSEGRIKLARSVGRVSVLEHQLKREGLAFEGSLGIAHTRWATHGRVTEANAHPHVGQTRQGHTIALVHNGTIENYATLKRFLEDRGHRFYGESDTEVLAKLVAELYQPAEGLEAAVKGALREVMGAYAISVICNAEPRTLLAARKGSPLIIGLAAHSYVLASDASAIIAHTPQVIHLEDYQIARLQVGTEEGGHGEVGFRTTSLDSEELLSPEVTELELQLEQIERAGYEHFMLKEIMEQPESLRTCLKGRMDLREGRVVLGGLSSHARDLVQARRFVLLGQGTAYHAGLIGEYLFEELTRIPAQAEYASEFRYRNPIIEEGSVMIAVSQSGETSDTLAALEESQLRGALTLGAVNVVGSTMSRVTDAGVYLRVGPEVGVASTKAFTGQVAVLTLMALYIGRRRHLSAERVHRYLEELAAIPEQIAAVCRQSEPIRRCVQKVVDRENWLYLGRGYNYPVALEGALKLKEISYIHAEGMPAAEMKHGPIALIDEGMPVVFIATRGSQYDKCISNIEEVRARGGRIIAIATEGDDAIDRYCEEDFIFRVPDVSEPLQPLLTTIPLQLIAYHAAVLRGQDVDKPRNLAKSVTVE